MTDSILIVGGGVAGLRAALDCAAAGARAIVVERGPVIGGRLAAPMTRAKAIGNRAEGQELPLFDALADNENIEILTNATLEELTGRPGNFMASIAQRARFVTDACTRCKLCHTACPVVRPNEYDAGLTFRKAIYTPLAETFPAPYVIDIESCLNTPPNYLPCNRCVEVCDDDAIFFDVPLVESHERHVGAVVLAPGFKLEDNAAYAELGYAKHADVVTSAELQRLLETPGPTGGFATRPSNEEYPDSVLLVVDKLSRFALYIVASQVRQLLDQDVPTVGMLVLTQPGSEQVFEEAGQFAADTGIDLRWGTMFNVDASPDGLLEVSFEDFASNRFTKASYDMVVLCTDVEPPSGIADLASAADVDLTEGGYLAVSDVNGAAVAASRPGVFVAGCASGAKTIRDSIADAEAAARAATAELDPRQLRENAAASAKPARDAPVPGSDPELQARVEQLLYALLERQAG